MNYEETSKAAIDAANHASLTFVSKYGDENQPGKIAINITPGSTKFARYCKSHLGATKGTNTGIDLILELENPVSSLAANREAALAWCSIWIEAGIPNSTFKVIPL